MTIIILHTISICEINSTCPNFAKTIKTRMTKYECEEGYAVYG